MNVAKVGVSRFYLIKNSQSTFHRFIPLISGTSFTFIGAEVYEIKFKYV